MKWIEFIGVPGSGKSVCCDVLIDRLSNFGFDCISEETLLRSLLEGASLDVHESGMRDKRGFFRRLMTHGRYRTQLTRHYLSNHIRGYANPLHLRRFRRQPCYWLAEQLLWIDHWCQEGMNEPQQLFVTSEGVLHLNAAVTVWNNPRCAAYSTSQLERLLRDECAVVFVNIPAEVAFDRMVERGIPKSWPSRCQRDPSVARTYHEAFASAIQTLVDRVKQAGIYVSEIDNSGSRSEINEPIELIAKQIAGLNDSIPHPSKKKNVVDFENEQVMT